MAYEKFDPDKTDILMVSIQKHGNISAIADHYKVSRETIYQYFKRDAVGKSIIQQVRGSNTETDLDLAEHVNRFNMMNYRAKPALGQRAAEMVLNKKGHLRDWGNQGNALPPNDSQVNQDLSDIKSFNLTAYERIKELERELSELKSKTDSELPRSQ